MWERVNRQIRWFSSPRGWQLQKKKVNRPVRFSEEFLRRLYAAKSLSAFFLWDDVFSINSGAIQPIKKAALVELIKP